MNYQILHNFEGLHTSQFWSKLEHSSKWSELFRKWLKCLAVVTYEPSNFYTSECLIVKNLFNRPTAKFWSLFISANFSLKGCKILYQFRSSNSYAQSSKATGVDTYRWLWVVKMCQYIWLVRCFITYGWQIRGVQIFRVDKKSWVESFRVVKRLQPVDYLTL